MTSCFEDKKVKYGETEHYTAMAQPVRNHLNALADDRSNKQTRWIWELLQNAHDASVASDQKFIARINDNSKELVFLHNGSGFTIGQIYHLIFHGSTKVEDEKTIGQYGSGFLATHLLSWDIDVSGLLDNIEDPDLPDDGKYFNFRLTRKPGEKVEELADSMKNTWDNLKPVSLLSVPIPEDFTTRFLYPITEESAKAAVRQGIKTLEQCAPFMFVFNKVFHRIDFNIKERSEDQSLKIFQRRLSVKSGLREITVIRSRNENHTELKYLLAEGKKASVAVRLESNDDRRSECLSIERTPRLFVAFPLIGTESFSFPAVINGNPKFFKPTDNRDGVLIGEGKESDTNQNRSNQDVIREACELLVSLIKEAASKGWDHVHQWIKIPSAEKLESQEWLRNQIKEELIEKIRETPVVLTLSDKPIETKAATIPVAKSPDSVERLWDLLEDHKEYRERLPRQDESKGWYNAFKSWAKVHSKDSSEEFSEVDISKVFPEVMNARALANNLEDCTGLRDLQKLLQENVSPIEWLDQLYGFLKDDRLFDDKIRSLCIFPNQDGEFCQLDDLHPDRGIDKKLKDIDKLLKGKIHKKLRSDVLHSLEDERRTEGWDNKQVVNLLIKQLQKLHKEMNSDDNFKKATTHLFAWIVRQDRREYWEYLQNVPVFTDDGEFHYSLREASSNNIPPFAPIYAWQKDLQEFSDIFPQNRILASEYFEILPDSNDWRKLNEEGIVRMDKDEDIITYEEAKKINFKDFCPRDDDKLNQQEDSEHKTANCIVVTSVKELSDIMRPLRGKPELAVKFWRFLTEWLIKKDTQGFKEVTLECESCTANSGKIVNHKCYTAAWLKPVRDNQWVRRVSPSPKSLANLLRGKESVIRELRQNQDIDKLLYAIGVPPADLQLDLLAENPVKRDKAVNFAAEVYGMPEDKIDGAHKVLQYIKEGGDSILKDIEKNESKRRTINENRSVGKQVEEFVRQILTEKFPKKKFNVKPDYIGADFEIVELEVTQGAQKLWIEVKSTRNKSNSQEVKMSSEQAKKAVKKNANFLLCVVPIPEGVEIDLETVRKNMRFIANIGDRVSQLYDDIVFLEEVREYITEDLTAETIADVRLTVDSGEIGVLIKNSVWEKNGFPLDELVEHLIRTNNNIVTY